jgi:hypothetical protein
MARLAGGQFGQSYAIISRMIPTTPPTRGRPRRRPYRAHDRRYVLLHLSNAYRALMRCRAALYESPEVLAYLQAHANDKLAHLDLAYKHFAGAFVDVRRELLAGEGKTDG